MSTSEQPKLYLPTKEELLAQPEFNSEQALGILFSAIVHSPPGYFEPNGLAIYGLHDAEAMAAMLAFAQIPQTPHSHLRLLNVGTGSFDYQLLGPLTRLIEDRNKEYDPVKLRPTLVTGLGSKIFLAKKEPLRQVETIITEDDSGGWGATVGSALLYLNRKDEYKPDTIAKHLR